MKELARNGIRTLLASVTACALAAIGMGCSGTVDTKEPLSERDQAGESEQSRKQAARRAARRICANKKPGDACKVKVKSTLIYKGRCARPNNTNACLPTKLAKRVNKRHNKQPPTPRVVQACRKKKPGSSCTFKVGATAYRGTCKTGGGVLYCHAKRVNKKSNGNNGSKSKSPAAKACTKKSAGTSCRYKRKGRSVRGTCKKLGKRLICQPKPTRRKKKKNKKNTSKNKKKGTRKPVAGKACAKRKAGSSCSFKLNGRTVKGTCRKSGGRTVCTPKNKNNKRGGGGKGTCTGKNPGAKCTVKVGGQPHKGVCVKRRGAAKCRPVSKKRGCTKGGKCPNPIAKACKGKKSGAKCVVKHNGRKVHTGTCRRGLCL